MPQRRVLITGAGSGLGRALAERYAAAGWAIARADIHAGPAADTAAALPGPGHFATAGDVGDDHIFHALEPAIPERWQVAVDVPDHPYRLAPGHPPVPTQTCTTTPPHQPL